MSRRVQKLVDASLPSRANLVFQLVAKYLGFHIGPAARTHDFRLPMLKLESRTRLAAELLLSASQAISSFNVRAVTVLSYVSQLAPALPEITSVETWAANEITRLPGCTLAGSLAFRLCGLGPKLRPPVVACLAATSELPRRGNSTGREQR